MKKTVGGSIHIDLDSSEENFGAGVQNENGMAYQYNGDYITQEVIDAIAGVDGVVDCSAESAGGYWGLLLTLSISPEHLALIMPEDMGSRSLIQ